MKNVFVAGFLVVLLFMAGCSTRESNTTASSGTAAAPAQTQTQTTQQSQQTQPQTPNQSAGPTVETRSEREVQESLLSTVKKLSVSALSKNWDEDAEDDGIVVYPDLQDAGGQTVKFDNYVLNVSIEIWTLKFDDNFNQVKDRLIYSGTSTIDSWKDGNMFYEGGIKVPYEEIRSIDSDDEYGRLYAKVNLPDGRTIEAKTDLVRIKRPPE